PAPPKSTPQGAGQVQASDCRKPVFTEYFVDPKYLLQIGQVGTVHGSGRFTIERSYISVKNEFDRQKIPIYAPANITLVRGAYYQVPAPPGQYFGEPLPDYALYFDAGCGVEISWGHLKEAVPKIASQFSQPKQDSRTDYLKPVKFAAGELIGYYVPGAGVAAFDFFAYDQSVLNQFANQKRHEFGYADPMLHAVCPYDYYAGEMKDAYYSLIPGPATNKSCGPISRDYPGTISGMWFLDKEPTKYLYDYSQEGTYGSALPIAGDYDRTIIGTLGRRATTFIYPNNPTYRDPKDVTGEHCYQIYSYYNPSPEGYVYFKLMDNETLKVFYSEKGECPESFPAEQGATYYR
ncbi:MAG: hypothetical protein QW568_05495, partial [Candidatus Anstonellaceae archaeon]